MNSGKYIFRQLVEFLPQKEFYKLVKRYDADKWTKSMSCWNQLLLMMFGQLSGCDSLRELICIVAAHQNKSYHLLWKGHHCQNHSGIPKPTGITGFSKNSLIT